MKKTITWMLALLLLLSAFAPAALAEEGESRLTRLPDGQVLLEAEGLGIRMQIPEGWVFFGQRYEDSPEVYDTYFESAALVKDTMDYSAIHLYAWPDVNGSNEFHVAVNRDSLSEQVGNLDDADEGARQQALQYLRDASNPAGTFSLEQAGEHSVLVSDFGYLLKCQLVHGGAWVELQYRDKGRNLSEEERAAVFAIVESIRFDEGTGTGMDFSPDFTFATQDIDGGAWTESCFAEVSLTMINFWEPWCGPCVKEMPELQKLYETYRDRGFRILGIYSDFEYEEEMRQVVEQTGVQYPILEYVDVFNQFQTGYVPTTIFVDGSGHLVGETMIGSESYDEWAAVVEGLLK